MVPCRGGGTITASVCAAGGGRERWAALLRPRLGAGRVGVLLPHHGPHGHAVAAGLAVAPGEVNHLCLFLGQWRERCLLLMLSPPGLPAGSPRAAGPAKCGDAQRACQTRRRGGPASKDKTITTDLFLSAPPSHPTKEPRPVAALLTEDGAHRMILLGRRVEKAKRGRSQGPHGEDKEEDTARTGNGRPRVSSASTWQKNKSKISGRKQLPPKLP